MFEFQGRSFEKLALHGGGLPKFIVDMTFWEELNISIVDINFPLITSSAGSMSVIILIAKYFEKKCFNNGLEHVLALCVDEFDNFLTELDKPHIFSAYFFRQLFEHEMYEEFYTLTFGDLLKINNNLDWTIHCCRSNSFEHTTFGTHTPDILVWKTIYASCALPIICEPIEIGGDYFCDGDCTNWPKNSEIHEDETICHFVGRHKAALGLPLFSDLGIPIIATCISFIETVYSTQFRKDFPKENAFSNDMTPSIVPNSIVEKNAISRGKYLASQFVLK